MNTVQNSFNQGKFRTKTSRIISFTALLAASLAVGGSFDAAKADSGKVNPTKVERSVSLDVATIPPVRESLPINTISTIKAQVEPWAVLPIVIVGGLVIFVPLFFGGLVVIGEREVGIVVKKFTIGRKGLPAGSLIALNGEAGLQADTLAPGWAIFLGSLQSKKKLW
jgi:hypothetical protein